MKTLLFINHKEKQCGIYQYGIHVFEAFSKIAGYTFHYCECTTRQELETAILKSQCEGIIYNYHHRTLPFLHRVPILFRLPFLNWFRLSSIPGLRRLPFLKKLASMMRRSFTQKKPFLHPEILKKFKDKTHICLLHYMTQEMADGLSDEHYQYYMYGDPTIIENNPRLFKIPRLLPEYQNNKPVPEIVTIGSYGFAGAVKGFENLVMAVQNEFDEAIIRLNIPFNGISDKYGMIAEQTEASCRGLIVKPGIQLVVTNEFFDDEALMEFLAGNTLNAFFYHDTTAVGIASAPDYAIAVDRPIAVTSSNLFKHLFCVDPSIVIQNTSFKEILKNGCKPLEPLKEAWSEEAFIKDCKRVFDAINI